LEHSQAEGKEERTMKKIRGTGHAQGGVEKKIKVRRVAGYTDVWEDKKGNLADAVADQKTPLDAGGASRASREKVEKKKGT